MQPRLPSIALLTFSLLGVCACGNPDRVLDRPSARTQLAEEFTAASQKTCTMTATGRELRNATVRCDTKSLETLEATAQQQCPRYATFGFTTLTLQNATQTRTCDVQNDCACTASP